MDIYKTEKMLIVGPSGSGKDFLLRKLKELGLKTSVKITTRPKRQGEVDGVNYFFKENNIFEKLDLIVKQEFYNDKGDIWKYGILKEDFDNSQVFILTPGELSQISSEIRKKCFVVYLDIDRKIRENRIFKRNDSNDSIIRRLDADDLDFKNFSDYDLKITDPEFDAESVLSLMC
jgi:guanylate kinase